MHRVSVNINLTNASVRETHNIRAIREWCTWTQPSKLNILSYALLWQFHSFSQPNSHHQYQACHIDFKEEVKKIGKVACLCQSQTGLPGNSLTWLRIDCYCDLTKYPQITWECIKKILQIWIIAAISIMFPVCFYRVLYFKSIFL